MADEDQTYNGWANYATWCIHLHLNNDEGSQIYWGLCGREALEDSPDRAAAARAVGDQLKAHMEDRIEGYSERAGRDLLTASLLTASLDDVDWTEIGAAFLPEDPPHNEDKGDKPDG